MLVLKRLGFVGTSVFFHSATTTSCICRQKSVTSEYCRYLTSAETGSSTCRSRSERAAWRPFGCRKISHSPFSDFNRMWTKKLAIKFSHVIFFRSRLITQPAWVGFVWHVGLEKKFIFIEFWRQIYCLWRHRDFNP